MSDMQSDFRRLMTEINDYSDRKVIIKNPKLYDDLVSPHSNIDFSEENIDGNLVIVFSGLEFERFQDLLANNYDYDSWDEYTPPSDFMKHRKDPNYYSDRPNDFFDRHNMEEMSTTSGAGAYLTKAKLSENINSGYKKVKGFRPGHSKINIVEPKDLWNMHEEIETSLEDKKGVEIKVGDRVKILSNPKGGFGEVIGFDEKKASVKVTQGGGSTYERPASYFPKEIEKVEDEKEETKQKKPKETSPEEIPIKENYARFRNETKTRSKSQQFHEAAKMVEKKLREINKILEYTSKLKSELFEDENCNECYSRTGKVMEKITKNIAEAYSKVKKIK